MQRIENESVAFTLRIYTVRENTKKVNKDLLLLRFSGKILIRDT